MMNIRKLFFWLHLILGCSAAIFVFLMSVTGVALTYERQMIKSAEQADYPKASTSHEQRLPLTDFVELAKDYPTKKAPQIVLLNEKSAPIIVKDGRKTVAYLNPFTGTEIAKLGDETKNFFSKLRAFHRWLTLDGKFSDMGRWVNGIANLFFVVLILSGLYLWLPKRFKYRAFKQKLTLSNDHSTTQARNYQWHNVFGIYMAPILFVIAFTAIFFSFKWPGEILKENLSIQSIALPTPIETDEHILSIDKQISQIETYFPQWQSISFEVSQQSMTLQLFSVDKGNGGEPQKRISVALDTLTGDIIQQQNFEQLSPYRKARSYIRFLHTGEAFGLLGQTLAGLASLLACLLVYTGVMLSWNRWKNSRNK
jgi:uncharacterized iron-regulated membrane protein